MMDEIVNTVAELVDARLSGDNRELTRIVDRIVRGPKWDSWAVVATIAACVGEGMAATGPEGMHVLRVNVIDMQGDRREGTADDLPPAVRAFTRIVTALNNGDRSLAQDVFIAYVGEHSNNAVRLIAVALRMFIDKAYDVASGAWPGSTMPTGWLDPPAYLPVCPGCGHAHDPRPCARGVATCSCCAEIYPDPDAREWACREIDEQERRAS